MADIVDALVVSLGLDPTQYNREIKKYRDDRKRLAEDDAKYNQSQETAQKRQIEGMRTLRNETAGFVLALAGASSIKSFVSDLISSDAATGRFASNLGLATEKVAAWEEAVKRSGGSAGGGRGLLGQMSSLYQNYQMTGDRNIGATLSALGFTEMPSDPQEMLFKLAEASGTMSKGRYRSLLGQLGVDDAGVTLLSKGRQGLQEYIVQMQRLSNVHKEDTDNAIAFENAMLDIETTLKSKARPAVEGIAGAIAQLTRDGDGLNTVMAISEGLLVAVGVAAAGALGPIGILAGAVAILTAKYVDLNKAGAAWQILGLRADKFYAEAQAEQFSRSDPKKSLAYRERASEDADLILRLTESANSTPNYGAATQWSGGLGLSSRPGGGRMGGGAVGQVGAGLLSSGAGGTDPEIYRALAARYGPQIARGITAGIKAEGGSLGMAANGAFGIGQWRGPRQRALFAKYGRNPTKQQQLEFLISELEGGDFGGKSVLSSRSDVEALSNYIGGDNWGFMRPGIAGRVGDMRRGLAALGRPGMMAGRGGMGGGGSVTNNVTVGEIRINTSSKDAEGIARDMRGELAKRGLVTQANTGLTG